ncbi:Golgi to ER traffic protein 4 [Intoshia linei]|uniref:Golgi to ER traffic protein 4 n=1 Tax=Intoshia linei TaxID=1819745 RepID=A0A177B7Q9_9BILA|nr:Golgi to ER traffic protein 4 [Intoshia linei]
MKNFDKFIEKINRYRDSEQYYDAFQNTLSLSHRLFYENTNQFVRAANCIYSFIIKLHLSKNINMGYETANIYVALFTNATDVKQEYYDQLLKLYSIVDVKYRGRFEKNLISIFEKQPSFLPNHDVHLCLSFIALKASDFYMARYHVLQSGDPSLCVYFLKNLCTKYPDIDYLFIVQLSLQLLCIRKLTTTKTVFVSISKKYRNNDLYSIPLLNFVYFMLLYIQEKELENYDDIINEYCEYLSEDSYYDIYLKRIRHIYFEDKSTEETPNFFHQLCNSMQNTFGKEENSNDLFSRETLSEDDLE